MISNDATAISLKKCSNIIRMNNDNVFYTNFKIKLERPIDLFVLL